MEYKRAIEIIQNLIDSVDPYTGRIYDPDNCYMNVEINKALTEAVKVLRRASKKDPTKQFSQSNEKLSEEAKLLLVEQYDAGMIVRELAKEHHIKPKEIKRLLVKLGRFSLSRPMPERGGQKWDQQEIDLLVERFDSGMNISQLAEKHQRTVIGIASRLIKIGKISRKDESF